MPSSTSIIEQTSSELNTGCTRYIQDTSSEIDTSTSVYRDTGSSSYLTTGIDGNRVDKYQQSIENTGVTAEVIFFEKNRSLNNNKLYANQ